MHKRLRSSSEGSDSSKQEHPSKRQTLDGDGEVMNTPENQVRVQERSSSKALSRRIPRTRSLDETLEESPAALALAAAVDTPVAISFATQEQVKF